MKNLAIIIFSAVITVWTMTNYRPENHSEILAIASPLATVAGILFGFVIASSTFISGNSNNSLIQNLKSQNMYQGLIDRLHHTGMWLIMSCIFMVLSIFSPAVSICTKCTKFSDINWDYGILVVGFFCLFCGLLGFLDAWKKIRLVTSNL